MTPLPTHSCIGLVSNISRTDSIIAMHLNDPPHDIAKLAAAQIQDYRSNNPGTCFEDPGFSIDIATAYELQDAVTALRVASGERVIGYKVGCTGPGTRAQFGMDGPIRGTLFEDEARRNGARLDPDAFCQLAIEGEMALRIDDDGAIEAAFPVIELHNFVFRADRKTLSELIANNGINAGIVLPDNAWQQSPKHIHVDGVLSLRINGSEVGSAGLWPNDAGPDASLMWLKQNLEDRQTTLSPGDIVLAGTALGLYPVKDGDDVTVCIDQQPAVSCMVKT